MRLGFQFYVRLNATFFSAESIVFPLLDRRYTSSFADWPFKPSGLIIGIEKEPS